MHLSEGQLQAYLNHKRTGTPAPDAPDGVLAHLAACPRCRERARQAAARHERVAAHLAALDPAPGETSLAAGLARARLAARITEHQRTARPTGRWAHIQEEYPMLKSLNQRRLRPVWSTLAVVLTLAFALGFSPVRAWAGQFLGLFRVQQVTVLPVDTTRLSQLTGDSALADQIGQLLSSSVTFTRKPGDPTPAAGAAQATQLAGFAVRLPGNRAEVPTLSVQSGAAFELIVDRARAQALLDEAGHSDLQLPAALDGATIKVNIPDAVTASYGECPPLNEGAASQSGSSDRGYPDCVIFTQIPSPTVDAPPDLDVARLAELGLQFTGMSAAQARAYARTVDWTSTLVIPIPRNAASYRQVAVDGVTGTLIERPGNDAPQFALIWVKDGIIYAIGGPGNYADQALAMANALK